MRYIDATYRSSVAKKINLFVKSGWHPELRLKIRGNALGMLYGKGKSPSRQDFFHGPYRCKSFNIFTELHISPMFGRQRDQL